MSRGVVGWIRPVGGVSYKEEGPNWHGPSFSLIPLMVVGT